MKKVVLFFCTSLIFLSCSQKENKIDIEMQSQIMKGDPIVIEYFRSISASAKFLAEEEVDLDQYYLIIKQNNSDICNVNKDIFKGDLLMEKFAIISCQLKKSTSSFLTKYPFVQNMERDEKRKLFAPLMKKTEYDIEKIKQRGEKHIPRE